AASSGCSTPVGSSLASTAASRISARSALNNAGRRGGGRSLEPSAQDPCLTDREKPAVSAAAARQTRSAARRRVLPASGYGRDRIDAQSLPFGWSARSRRPLQAALLYRQSSPRPPLEQHGNRMPPGPLGPRRCRFQRPGEPVKRACWHSRQGVPKFLLNRPKPTLFRGCAVAPAGAARGKSA